MTNQTATDEDSVKNAQALSIMKAQCNHMLTLGRFWQWNLKFQLTKKENFVSIIFN